MSDKLITVTEASSVVELIRNASLGDIAVVSFLVLPIPIGAWTFLLNNIGVLPQSNPGRLWLLAGLFIFYISAVIVMKLSESARSRRLRAARRIFNTLEGRPAPNQGFGSFNYIRERVDETFSNAFMLELIKEYPDLFVKGKTRDGGDAVRLIIDVPEKPLTVLPPR